MLKHSGIGVMNNSISCHNSVYLIRVSLWSWHEIQTAFLFQLFNPSWPKSRQEEKKFWNSGRKKLMGETKISINRDTYLQYMHPKCLYFFLYSVLSSKLLFWIMNCSVLFFCPRRQVLSKFTKDIYVYYLY